VKQRGWGFDAVKLDEGCMREGFEARERRFEAMMEKIRGKG